MNKVHLLRLLSENQSIPYTGHSHEEFGTAAITYELPAASSLDQVKYLLVGQRMTADVSNISHLQRECE